LRQLTESVNLLGRGLDISNSVEDVSHRVLRGSHNNHEVRISSQDIENNIKRIFAEEIGFMVDPDTIYQHLNTAPLWAKKGAHHHPLLTD